MSLRSDAQLSVRSGACEREEWSCVLVARLKVCSIAERGTGGGRTSSRWLARGVGDGGQLACAQRGFAASTYYRCLTQCFAVLVDCLSKLVFAYLCLRTCVCVLA